YSTINIPPPPIFFFFGNSSSNDYMHQTLTNITVMEVPRNNTLEARVMAVGQLYDARMTEITQNLLRAPADIRFCKTCVLANKWPIDVSGMSAEVSSTFKALSRRFGEPNR